MSLLLIGDPAIHSVLVTLWHYSRFAVTALAVSMLLAACDGHRGNSHGDTAAARAALVSVGGAVSGAVSISAAGLPRWPALPMLERRTTA